MAEVLEFPDRGDRTWARNSAFFTDMLTQAGHDPDAVHCVIEELKPLFLEAWQHPVVSREADLDVSIRRLNDWVGSFSLRLLLMTALAKLALRQALPLPDSTSGHVAAQQPD